MPAVIDLLNHYGLWAIFVAVLLDQGGIPLPSFPVMVVAGALAAQRGDSLGLILLTAVGAALLADLLWYSGGRRFGALMIRLICRLSLSPDTCVGTTRGIYARWGAPSLLVAKFIPGVAAVATTLAGQMRTGLPRFILFDGVGAALWAGAALLVGVVFRDAVYGVLTRLVEFGRMGLLALLVAVALFGLYKLWRRQHFLRLIRMARITPDELYRLMDSDTQPVVLDARADGQRQRAGWIPGALAASDLTRLDLEAQPEVVIYCDCPNEASAALLARQLMKRGFAHVRPLAGGFDAWAAGGLPVTRDTSVAEQGA